MALPLAAVNKGRNQTVLIVLYIDRFRARLRLRAHGRTPLCRELQKRDEIGTLQPTRTRSPSGDHAWRGRRQSSEYASLYRTVQYLVPPR